MADGRVPRAPRLCLGREPPAPRRGGVAAVGRRGCDSRPFRCRGGIETGSMGGRNGLIGGGWSEFRLDRLRPWEKPSGSLIESPFRYPAVGGRVRMGGFGRWVREAGGNLG